MSRAYGRVYTSYWNHPKIRAITAECEDARELGVYLLTSPHSNSIGSYLLPDGYAVDDLQWGSERVAEGFRILSKHGFAHRFGDGRHVAIADYVRQWNKPENQNVLKGMVTQFDQLPKDLMRIYPLAGIMAYPGWLAKGDRTRLPKLFEELQACFFEHFRNPFEIRTEPEPLRTRTGVDGDSCVQTPDKSSTQLPRAREAGETAEGLGNDGAPRTAVRDLRGRLGADVLAEARARHKLKPNPAKV